MSDETNPAQPARRTVLKVAGGLVGITFLAGCGGGGTGGDQGGAAPDPEKMKAVEQAVRNGDIAVGKAKFLPDAGVVVTRPSEKEYKVFSDVCPHQNGKVTEQDPQTGRLVCLLHGSQFDPATGQVVVGPSAAGLREYQAPLAKPTA